MQVEKSAKSRSKGIPSVDEQKEYKKAAKKCACQNKPRSKVVFEFCHHPTCGNWNERIEFSIGMRQIANLFDKAD